MKVCFSLIAALASAAMAFADLPEKVVEQQLPVPTHSTSSAGDAISGSPARLPTQVAIKKVKTVKDFKVGDSGYFNSDLIYVDNKMGVWLIADRKVDDVPKQLFKFIRVIRKADGFHIEIYPSESGEHRKWEPGDKEGKEIRGWGWFPARTIKIKTLKDRNEIFNQFNRSQDLTSR
tara:strand:+ start:731 stop:1258 length:528 start_codon:yes stop_codon:yes gene_type:complete